MHINQEGLAIIKSEEGLRLTAYTCPAGVLTIGYGHTGPDVYAGEVISEIDAVGILQRDLARFEVCVSRVCEPATPHQFSAMVSLAFNIGEAAFERSSVARLHNAGQHAEAGQAFALWNKAGGRVLPGLVRRRAAEAALYMQGTYFADEHAPAATAEGEKPLPSSRAIVGQTVAGGATAVGLVADAVKDHLDILPSLQDAFYQLSPYFEFAKWGIATVVLIGVAYAVYARVHDRHTGRA